MLRLCVCVCSRLYLVCMRLRLRLRLRVRVRLHVSACACVRVCVCFQGNQLWLNTPDEFLLCFLKNIDASCKKPLSPNSDIPTTVEII